MRIIYFGILFFLIISNQSAFGQDWQDLLIRADSLSDSLDYDSAIIIGNLALQEAEKVSGRESLAVAKADYQLGEYYLTCSRYSEAESSLKRSLDIRRKILGDNHADVATALDRLGRLYTEICRFPEADSCLEKSLAIRKRLFDEESLEMAETFLSLGALYTAWHHYEAAEPLLTKARNIRESLLEADHPDIAECLDHLCLLYCYDLRHDESERIGLKALEIYEGNYGLEHPATVGCRNNISKLYIYQSRFDEAKPLLDLSKEVTAKIFGFKHRNMVELLLFLGSIYMDESEYETSYDYFNEALLMAEEIFQYDNALLAECMHGLSTLQIKYKGNVRSAESFMKKAVAISERLFDEDDRELGYKLTDLADIYIMQGKLPEAESLLRGMLVDLEKTDFDNLGHKAICLALLGSVYMFLNEYGKAEEYLEKAVVLADSLWEADNDQNLYIKARLALTLCRREKFTRAESLFNKIIDIFEKKYGPDNLNTVLSQFELCLNYLHKSEPQKAEALLQKCLEHFNKHLGSNHQKSISTLLLMSNAKRQMGKSEKAFEIAKTAYDIFEMTFEEYSTSVSEKDALTYSRVVRNYFDMLITCYFEYNSGNNAFTESVAEVIFNFKGRVSDRAFSRKRFLDENADSMSIALQESIRKAKQKLSDAYVAQYNSDCKVGYASIYTLDSQVEFLNDKLIEHAKNQGFDGGHGNMKISQIADLLPVNSVLVEFCKYAHWSKTLLGGTGHYAAVILDKNAKPVILDLGVCSEIDANIEEYSAGMYRVSSRYVIPTESDEAEYIRVNNELCHKIWEPIEQYLTGKDFVIIVPDGELNVVSFAGLACREGKYLIEKYAIHYLASAGDLFRMEDSLKCGSGLFAIGDPNFDAPNGLAAHDSLKYEDSINIYSSKNIRSSCLALNEKILNRIPETRKEVESIAAEWHKNSNESVEKYLGDKATEGIFKSNAPGKRVIHIATHGFYIGDECSMNESESLLYRYSAWSGENPLLHCGIFLAGANRHGEGADSAGIEDGILSAYEVSTMDLNGTDLVVLSTCESGLGKIKSGEDVYGLRRAFQVAGARTVISTLWPIMDKTSSEMLSQLYNRQGRSLPETLREIQLKKINELREQNKSDHPASWAPYIILGDWQ